MSGKGDAIFEDRTVFQVLVDGGRTQPFWKIRKEMGYFDRYIDIIVRHAS